MFNRKILVVDNQKEAREGLADAILNSARQDESKSLLEKMRPKLSAKNSEKPSRFSLEQDIIYDVDTASDGQTACTMIRQNLNNGTPYNLIFLDMRMFGWDGLKSMEEIFKIDKKVQVVLCTAFTDHTWEDISEKVGRRDNFLILKKPFDDMEVAQLALTLTEKYYTEANLRHSQKMETVGELAAGLAHDFNNIIAALRATLSSVEFSINNYNGDTILKNELKGDLETMNNAIHEGAEMVQILLSLSKRQELPLSPVNLNELMKHVLKICSRSLDKSVEVRYTPSTNKAMISAYSAQIEQVLLNLCINADHAMTIMRPPGEKRGGKLTIIIQDEILMTMKRGNITEIPPGKYRCISIDDTGVGMTPKIISQIFDPFFTTKSKEKGSGLGLSMVFNIIQKHKGFLDLYSLPGKGTVFYLYLPFLEQ
jgi:signal transduction histidine kinase